MPTRKPIKVSRESLLKEDPIRPLLLALFPPEVPPPTQSKGSPQPLRLWKVASVSYCELIRHRGVFRPRGYWFMPLWFVGRLVSLSRGMAAELVLGYGLRPIRTACSCRLVVKVSQRGPPNVGTLPFGNLRTLIASEGTIGPTTDLAALATFDLCVCRRPRQPGKCVLCFAVHAGYFYKACEQFWTK